MTYMTAARLAEIADLIAPKVMDQPHPVFKRPHIIRFTGLLPKHHPYLIRFDVAADQVGGVWFSTQVEAYYGLLDLHSEFMSTRLTELPQELLIQQAQHLIRVLSSEIELNHPVPDQHDLPGMRTWLQTHTHTSEAQLNEFLDTYKLR